MLYSISLYSYITKDNFIVVLPPITREFSAFSRKSSL